MLWVGDSDVRALECITSPGFGLGFRVQGLRFRPHFLAVLKAEGLLSAAAHNSASVQAWGIILCGASAQSPDAVEICRPLKLVARSLTDFHGAVLT